MSQEVMGYFISTLTPILVGGVGISVRILIMWMRAQKNVTLHTLGEFAYNEVQSNFTGVAGEQKMKIAIEKVRARLVNTPWKNIDDDAIIKALQKAWYNQEGQYKNTPQTTVVLQPIDVPQPAVVPLQPIATPDQPIVVPAQQIDVVPPVVVPAGQTIATPEPSIVVPEPSIVVSAPSIVTPEPSIVVPEPSIVTPMQPIVVSQPTVAPQTLVPSSQPAIISQPSTVAPQQVTTGTPLNQILNDVNTTGTGAANALQPTATVVGPERTY